MAKNSPQDLENREYFSSNLNRIMAEKGVRQIDLHDNTDIPKSTITGYVKGRSLPTPGNLQKIADFLNVKKSDLDNRFGPNDLQRLTAKILREHMENFPFSAEEKNQLTIIKDALANFLYQRLSSSGYTQTSIVTPYVLDRTEAVADYLVENYDISSVFDILYPHLNLPSIQEDLQELARLHIVKSHTINDTEQKKLKKLLTIMKTGRDISD